MGEHAGVGAAEIDLEPVVDARHQEFAVRHLRASRVVDVLRGALLQKPLQVVGAEGLRGEVGAADARAIHGVVNARIAPDGPENAVLNVVQRQLLAGNGDEFQVPRAEVDEAALDVLDRLHRVAGHDDEHGERVVEIDPVGHLLSFREGAGIERGQAAEIGAQFLAVFGVGLEGPVVEAVNARGVVGQQIAVEDFLPSPMVDGGRVGFVAGVPHGDQLRFLGRKGQAGHAQQQRKGHSLPRPVPLLPAEPRDHAQDAAAGADGAAQGAADFGLADALTGVHRHLDRFHAVLDGLHLHLHRPAERGVAHVEAGQGLAANGAVGAEIARPLPPECADQTGGYPVARPLAAGQCALVLFAQGARADHQIGPGANAVEQAHGLVGVKGVVGVGEQHDVRGRQSPDGGLAGAAVAGLAFVHDSGAGFLGAGCGGVGGAVVANHDLIDDAGAVRVALGQQIANHQADRLRFVQGRNRNANGHAVVHGISSKSSRCYWPDR